MTEKILIIAPHLRWLSSIAMVLHHQRFHVLVAMTGREGLNLAVGEAPNLIVLDPGLPDLDGLELCQRLRAHAVTTRVPIVIVTRRDEIADRLAAFKAGADDYLSRPFDLHELVARIRAILRRTSRRSPPTPQNRAGPRRAAPAAPLRGPPRDARTRLSNTGLLAP